MKFTDSQRLDLLEELLESEAHVFPQRDGVKVELSTGREIESESLRACLDVLLSEDPGTVRHPEPLDEVRALVPEATAIAIRHQVFWSGDRTSIDCTISVQRPEEGFVLHKGNTYPEAHAALARDIARITPFRK